MFAVCGVYVCLRVLVCRWVTTLQTRPQVLGLDIGHLFSDSLKSANPGSAGGWESSYWHTCDLFPFMFLLCVLQGLCEGHHSFWRGSFELRSPNTNATNAGLNIDLIYLFIRHYKKFKKTRRKNTQVWCCQVRSTYSLFITVYTCINIMQCIFFS